LPSVLHDATPLSAQTARGSAFPVAIMVQVPGAFGELQVRQAPPQAL
jgi:hypothetical protein